MSIRFKDSGPAVVLPNDDDYFVHDGASGTRTSTFANLKAGIVSGISGGMTFRGTVAGASVPATSTSTGDYYVIHTDGTAQGKDWKVGDMAIYRGSSGVWDKIASYRPVVNIQQFGATGGDSADETTYFTLALSLVPTGTVIFVPRGTYQIDNFVQNKDVSFAGEQGAVLKHRGSATNHMIRQTVAQTGSVTGIVFDGNQQNQTVASNFFGTIFTYCNGQTFRDCRFKNYARAAILDFQSLGDLALDNCLFLNGAEVEDSDNTSDHTGAAVQFTPGLVGGVCHLTLTRCVFRQDATPTSGYRAPGGLLVMGSDANSSFNSVQMSQCRFKRVGDQSPNGRGIAAIDIYEDTVDCQISDVRIVDTYFTAAKLQNIQNLQVNGLIIRNCSYTIAIDYCPGERLQEDEYKNASFSNVYVDGSTSAIALYIHSGDQGGFHNVTVTNFIARDVLIGIKLNGLNATETEYEGYGPILISNAQIYTVSTQAALLIENFSGSVKLDHSYLNAASGHCVRCVTNTTSTAKLSVTNSELITSGSNGFYCFDVWNTAELTLADLVCEQTGGFAIGRLSHATATFNIGKMTYRNINMRTGAEPTVTWGDIDEVQGQLIFTGLPGTLGVNAKRGATFINRTGGANTTFYVKESDTGSSNWAAK